MASHDIPLVADARRKGVRRAFIDAVAKAKGGLPQQQIAAAIAEGRMHDAFVIANGAWEEASLSWRAVVGKQLRDTMEAGAEASVKGPSARMAGQLDVVNPEAVRAAREQAAKLVVNVTEETRAAIRTIITKAMQGEDLAPRKAAKLIKDTLGLNVRQTQAVAAFRERLETQEVPVARLENMIERYASKLLLQRATVIARTETMEAANEGQRQLWEQGVESGELDESLEQVWIVTDDEKTLCDRCEALDGARAPIGGTFPRDGGEGPPLHPNCRCTVGLAERQAPRERLVVARHDAAVLARREEARQQMRVAREAAREEAAALRAEAREQARVARADVRAGREAFRALRQVISRPAAAGEVAAEARLDAEVAARAARLAAASPESPEQLVMQGKRIVERKRLGGGVNQTILGTLDDGTQVVLKPVASQGPEAMLGEAAAYDIAQEVGMADMVPVTTVMQMPENLGLASAQEFKTGWTAADETSKAIQALQTDLDVGRARVFDFIMQNADRHEGNWMISPTGKVALIDNGAVFEKMNSYMPYPTASPDLLTTLHKQWTDALPRIEARLRKRYGNYDADRHIATIKSRVKELGHLRSWKDVD